MDPISDYAAFIAVADAGSFSAAAKRLGLTTAGTSKAVLRLEDRLGVRLFARTTRRVRLTEEGAGFLVHARAITADVAAAEEGLQNAAGRMVGRVRIDAPVVYVANTLVPKIAAFRSAHPDIEIDLRLADEVRDPIDTGADLAIRFGDVVPDGMIRRRLRTTRWWTVASPAYLLEAGTPDTPNDLTEHRTIAYTYRSTGRTHRWQFKNATFDPPHGLSVDDGFAHRSLTLKGAGLAQDVDAVLAPDVEAGRLVRVLTDWEVPGPEIGLIYPSRRLVPRRVKAIIEALSM